jgi:hypothetical protein
LQRALAELLTCSTEPGAELCAPFDAVDVARARGVLLRKRVDDALPLLPNLSVVGEKNDLATFALRVLSNHPRAARMVAVGDAFAIAEATLTESRWTGASRRDLLYLRAQYQTSRAGQPRRRSWPFVGRVSDGGNDVWAWRGFGPNAPFHVATRARNLARTK